MASATIQVSYWHDGRWTVKTARIEIENGSRLDRMKFLVGPDVLLDIPFWLDSGEGEDASDSDSIAFGDAYSKLRGDDSLRHDSILRTFLEFY